ncbi:hypothetical protein C8R45DRAFT_945758 [Mycena sanguinolenta]|nr:hypothetical protein C8R45DRAFT_945758 [Mycena sanguinolenta]
MANIALQYGGRTPALSAQPPSACSMQHHHCILSMYDLRRLVLSNITRQCGMREHHGSDVQKISNPLPKKSLASVRARTNLTQYPSQRVDSKKKSILSYGAGSRTPSLSIPRGFSSQQGTERLLLPQLRLFFLPFKLAHMESTGKRISHSIRVPEENAERQLQNLNDLNEETGEFVGRDKKFGKNRSILVWGVEPRAAIAPFRCRESNPALPRLADLEREEAFRRSCTALVPVLVLSQFIIKILNEKLQVKNSSESGRLAVKISRRKLNDTQIKPTHKDGAQKEGKRIVRGESNPKCHDQVRLWFNRRLLKFKILIRGLLWWPLTRNLKQVVLSPYLLH